MNYLDIPELFPKKDKKKDKTDTNIGREGKEGVGGVEKGLYRSIIQKKGSNTDLNQESGNSRVKLYKNLYSKIKEIGSLNYVMKESGEEWNIKNRSFMIPESLTRQMILNLGFEPKHIANVLVLFSVIKTSTDAKRAICKEKSPFVRLHSVVLREFLLTLNNQSKGFLKILESAKWIEIDNSYEIGVKSKGYRLGPQFNNNNWRVAIWDDTLDEFLPEILERSNIARQKDVLYSLWDRAKCYFSSYSQITDAEMRDICRKTQEYGLELIVKLPEDADSQIKQAALEAFLDGKKEKGEKYEWTVSDLIENYNFSLSRFNGVDFAVTCHDNRFALYTNRIHSNVTNVKKEFRGFLRFRGEKLYNVDIQSCQVALLATFYNKSAADQKEKEIFVQKICLDDIYLFVSNGRFDRKSAKKEMFKVMFDKNCNQKGLICDQFAKEFPILTKRISEQKKDNGYKSVARSMQLMEAEVMIKGVLKELYSKGVACFSIHDSILCRNENIPETVETITRIFTEKMGFCPKINTDLA